MPKLLFAGSFDPPTLGHMDLARRAAAYGPVTVALFINPDKHYLFTVEERLELLRRATADIPGVSVAVGEGYTADYARAGGYTHLVRGYRNAEDLAYENEMTAYNLARGGVETLLLPADASLTTVSSTRVREALHGGDTATLALCMPPACLAYLEELGKI